MKKATIAAIAILFTASAALAATPVLNSKEQGIGKYNSISAISIVQLDEKDQSVSFDEKY